jgi:hypothetical protein
MNFTFCALYHLHSASKTNRKVQDLFGKQHLSKSSFFTMNCSVIPLYV